MTSFFASLPTFGARRALATASAAASSGKLDDAAVALREYFGLRYRKEGQVMKGVDADAAMLAATCAILRGDADELTGVAALVEVGEHATTVAARRWIELLRAAAEGDVKKVFAEKDALASPALAPLLPAVLLVASERGLAKIGRDEADMLRRAFGDGAASSEVRARLALVLAAADLKLGRRAEAVRELAAIAADAPPLHRFFSLLAKEELDAASEVAGLITPEDRTSAGAFVARLAVGATSSVIERYLEIAGPFATAAQRAAIVAALATALAREGNAPRALGLLEVERQRSPGSAQLAVATAFAALAAGNPEVASNALRKLPPGEVSAVALRLVALAAKGDHETLQHELGSADVLSEAALASIQPVVLATLMRGGVTLSEERTPDWLAERPGSKTGAATSGAPAALYAWAVLRLRQGAPSDALAAFEEAIGGSSALANLGDAPDAARLGVARERLSNGDVDGAALLARKVTSPRHVESARRLAALATLKRLAAARGIPLDATSFANVVDTLRGASPDGSDERGLLDLLAGEARQMRARSLLRGGSTKDARTLVDAELGANWSSDAAYLGAIAHVLEGAAASEIEAYLARTTERAPSDPKNFVLLAEVRGALRGPDARLATLEPLRDDAASNGMLQEALAAAYGSARRGLDAKKVGLAEVRRAGGNPIPAIAAQIGAALSLEAPPASRARREAPITRAATASLFAKDQVGSRAHVLVGRATRALGKSPAARAAIEPLVERLKSAVLSDDLEEAYRAELELLAELGKVS